MPAAKDKAALLEVAEKEWGKLCALLDTVEAELAAHPFEDGWSIRDVVVHRAHWIDLFLGWYADGKAGREVHFPAKGYNWGQLKAYNAALLESEADTSWEAARAALESAHLRWSALVTSLDDAALYGAPMKGGRNAWTTGRWAEAAAPSHYRSAAKFIRACRRQAGR